MNEVTLNFITAEEEWARFDRAAQDLLHLSGKEFAARLDADDIADLPRSSSMRVAMLRPDTDG